MINYGSFQLANPPRTAGSWFMHIASLMGYGDGQKSNLHQPPPTKDWNGFVVSLVRHPCSWLESYFYALRGGAVGVPVVDELVHTAREALDVNLFAERVADFHRGIVTEIFDAYRPSTVMRVEDLPWAAGEFFMSLGHSRKEIQCILDQPLLNCRDHRLADTKISKRIRRLLADAESDIFDRYDYTA